ncbi:MAG: NTP transferase domain-containing protein [Oscillospiraceae bacterium]
MKLGAVVLAAGLSSRMREFKPMLTLGDNTIAGHTIGRLKAAGADPIVVVVGYKAELLKRYLGRDPAIRFAENERYAQTQMFDSVLIGLSALEQECDAVFVTPVDIPLVELTTFEKLIQSGAASARPVCNGKAGHPLLLSTDVISALRGYRGEGGLKGALHSINAVMQDVPVEDEGILLDADTPEDYKALLRREKQLRGGSLRVEMQLGIASDDVFMTVESIQLLEMIAHTGSIQAACACMHMSYSKGWRMVNLMERELGFHILERTAGGMAGGGSRLTAQGDELLAACQSFYLCARRSVEKLFRERFPLNQWKVGTPLAKTHHSEDPSA